MEIVEEYEISYCVARAEEELALAQRSKDARATAAHFQLAEMYLDRAYGQTANAENSAQAGSDERAGKHDNPA